MPTVILLDVSLSMAVPISNGENEYQKLHLAVQGLCQLLDFMNSSAKMESTALMVFSSKFQVLTTFSREFVAMKKVLMKVALADKTCIEVGLVGASQISTNTWKDKPYTQIILVTDGDPGIGPGSLCHTLNRLDDDGGTPDASNDFPLPFPFPSHLHIVALNSSINTRPGDKLLYERLIQLNNGDGSLWVPDNDGDDVTSSSVQKIFSEIAHRHYSPCVRQLRCGSLLSHIKLTPRPEPLKMRSSSSQGVRMWDIADAIKVVGVRNAGDFAIPQVLDRYVITPITEREYEDVKRDGSYTNKQQSLAGDESREPCAAVLLHGIIKLGKLTMLCLLSDEKDEDDWFAMLFSYMDPSKKKSCLMLAPFLPGSNSVEWLGPLTNLGVMPSSLDASLSAELPKLPVLPNPVMRRSYHDPDTVLSWIQPNGLQADVGKILRTAKKLPDKESLFYKELNKLRRNALGIGQHDLLRSLASLLDREREMNPSINDQASNHLVHAADSLRDAVTKSYNQNIMPYSFNK